MTADHKLQGHEMSYPPYPTSLVDQEPSTADFLHDVLTGLRRQPKHLPCKYFYDARGSQLFDRICDLDEYYPTRTELAIMEQYAPEMAAQIGPGVRLVEFGSGSSVKTRGLLDHLEDCVAYVPVDISREHLQRTAEDLSRAYPDIEILPVCADFTAEFDLPEPRRAPSHTAVYFPGSTIGNFAPADARALLRRIAPLCGLEGGLLLGVDLQKERAVLEAAYNDGAGVTAEFNLNLLRHINRELRADFRIDRFAHRAFYNERCGRIEMHLVSRCRQAVTIAGERFSFVEGEAICTEYSHKYTIDGMAQMAAAAGLTLRRYWTDPKRLFAVLHFAVKAERNGRKPR
ncbi:MAG: L-histidine N(alpha)-methyltransferase [Planctomycetota bacterium]